MFIKGVKILFVVLLFYLMTSTSTTPLEAYEETSPARRLHKAHALCTLNKSPPATDDNDNEQIVETFIRCMATKMGLWTDKDGYNAKQVAKFFNKHNYENEVMTIVDYCNHQHQQTNLDLWAYESYRCVTEGRIGAWLEEYYMLSLKLRL